jgi:hypothetical protein
MIRHPCRQRQLLKPVVELEEAVDDEPANYALPVKKRGWLEVSQSFLTTTIWFSMYVQHDSGMMVELARPGRRTTTTCRRGRGIHMHVGNRHKDALVIRLVFPLFFM